MLLIGSLLPLAARSKPKWGPVVFLVLVELLMIGALISFIVRSSWLYQVAMAGKILS
jgi:hypothetical protein